MLVTGGLGFMGSAFLRFMLENNLVKNKIINLDNMTYAANLLNTASIQGDPRYVFVKGSILDSSLLEELYKEFHFSSIVHFAAETHVDNSIASPEVFVQTNILGTFSLLEFVKDHRHIRLHVVSTDEVYGSLASEGYFIEDSPYQPTSPYAATKAAADHLARAYHKTYGLHITISHSCNNYGHGQHKEKLIPRMITNLINKDPLPIYGNGKNVRDWLFVEDHARAVYMIVQEGSPGSVYNIGANNEWANIDLIYLLITMFCDITGENVQQLNQLIQFVTDRPGHDYRYAISNQKIRKELGWTPCYDMATGLKKTMKWYLNEAEQNSLYHSCQARL
ncbi:MAG: dTDP-glucose 4,6-dehydratase [Chlamydiales bacterium]|nr:dTDP-glucose 4,6-dehydratase [Chlamydiales bacterium]